MEEGENDLAVLEVNAQHQYALEAFLRFSAFKRRQHLREVEYSFEEVKDMNLFEARQIYIRKIILIYFDLIDGWRPLHAFLQLRIVM